MGPRAVGRQQYGQHREVRAAISMPTASTPPLGSCSLAKVVVIVLISCEVYKDRMAKGCPVNDLRVC